MIGLSGCNPIIIDVHNSYPIIINFITLAYARPHVLEGQGDIFLYLEVTCKLLSGKPIHNPIFSEIRRLRKSPDL